MNKYNIDLNRDEYSEEVIFLMIQKLIRKEYDEYPVKLKRYLIAYIVMFIDTERLLESTLDLLEDFEFINEREHFENLLNESLLNCNYTENDIIKIKAICFSLVMSYTLKTKEFGKPSETPQLYFNVRDRFVESNMDEVDEYLKRFVFLNIAEKIETLPQPNRENHFRALISGLAKEDYKSGTDYFKGERTFLSELKDNLREPFKPINTEELKTPHPDIFKNREAFLIFKEFNDNHIIDTYPDYSFIYQQLLSDNLIREVKHKFFMDWLYKEGFISANSFENLVVKGFFRSLSKTSKGSRLNSYIKVKEKHIF